MSAVRLTKTKLITMMVASCLLITSCSPLAAQKQTDTNKSGEYKNQAVSEKILDNYAKGLKSDNTGLKRSCIYLAGYYGFTGLIEPLLDLFSKEKDHKTRAFIILALYCIDNETAIKSIEKMIISDNNREIRILGNAIVNH